MAPVTRIKTTYDRYVEWREEEVTRKRKHILRTLVAATLVIWAGAFALFTLFERTRQNDIDTQALVTYQVQIQAYNNAVTAHNECIERITRQTKSVEVQLDGLETDRQFLAILVTSAEATAQLSPPQIAAIAEITALYDRRETAILQDLAPDQPSDCPPVPVEVPVSPVPELTTSTLVTITTSEEP